MGFNFTNLPETPVTSSGGLKALSVDFRKLFAIQWYATNSVALSGCTIIIQESVDSSNWYDIDGTEVTITGDSTGLITGSCSCGMIRIYVSLTSGSLTLSAKANFK